MIRTFSSTPATSANQKAAGATRWLGQLWIEQRGRTGIQIPNEYYVTVARKLDPSMPPEDAWADVHALFASDPNPPIAACCLQAHDIEHRHRLSWWDSMMVAAAHLHNCALVLTKGP